MDASTLACPALAAWLIDDLHTLLTLLNPRIIEVP
jgi:hypothetical protein